METEIQETKAALRTRMRAVLKNVPSSVRAMGSAELVVRLKEQPVYSNARAVLFFAPLPEEPDVWPLLEAALAAGKTVALPRYSAATESYGPCRVRDLAADLRVGQYKIREPSPACAEQPLDSLDLVLVPGLAFGLRGGRLGRGRGFYDQLLRQVRGVKCGIAFDSQLVTELPLDARDVRVDCVLTPARWVDFRSGAGLETAG